MQGDVYKRLIEAAKEKYGDHLGVIKQLYEDLGITRQALYEYKKRNTISTSLAKRLENININPEFIKFGKEPKLIQNNDKPQSNVSEVGNVEMIQLPDIRTLTIEQMKELKEKIDDYSKKIEKILEAAEN